MTTRREFIKSAIASAVAAALPGLESHAETYEIWDKLGDGKWHHFAVVRESTPPIFVGYIDGIHRESIAVYEGKTVPPTRRFPLSDDADTHHLGAEDFTIEFNIKDIIRTPTNARP